MEFCKALAAKEMEKQGSNEMVAIYYKSGTSSGVENKPGAKDFIKEVDKILNDEKGWKKIFKLLNFVRVTDKIRAEMLDCPMDFRVVDNKNLDFYFRRLDNNFPWKPPILTITLVTGDEATNYCGGLSGLSCYSPRENAVFINYDNWECVSDACRNAAGAKPGDKFEESWRKKYWYYVIIHEVGHALGFDHINCSDLKLLYPFLRLLAPVMMQQTLGLQNCEPNVEPTNFDVEYGIPETMPNKDSSID